MPCAIILALHPPLQSASACSSLAATHHGLAVGRASSGLDKQVSSGEKREGKIAIHELAAPEKAATDFHGAAHRALSSKGLAVTVVYRVHLAPERGAGRGGDKNTNRRELGHVHQLPPPEQDRAAQG